MCTIEPTHLFLCNLEKMASNKTIRFDQLQAHEPNETSVKHEVIDDTIVRINPLLRGRIMWDIISFGVLFYNAIVIPLYIAFAIRESIFDVIFWLNRLADIFFFGTTLL
jgi:hypothetical protein